MGSSPTRKILVLFPYAHIAYSPTVLNICRMLRGRGHSVKVVFGIEQVWGGQTPAIEGVEFEQTAYSDRTMKFVRRADKYLWRPFSRLMRMLTFSWLYPRLPLRGLLLFRMMSKGWDTSHFDEVIAVDILSLYWASRRKVDCHFVSLEVDDYLPLIRLLDRARMKSVLIQTQERLERLFGAAEIKRFYVQNAPNFVQPRKRSTASSDLIYNGSAWAPFGAFDLIEFIKAYPDYRLHFKGNVHRDVLRIAESECGPLVRSGSLSFSEKYIDEDALREYLTGYSIGFCLYDFDNPDIAKRRFNYETAPSGKVYMYLASGLPVIATRIRGFQFIEDARAGVLLDDHKPESLKRAVDQIRADYSKFSDNALATGQRFSFDKAATPFIDFISND